MKLSPIVDHAYLLNVTPDQHHARDHKARHQKGGADDLESLLQLANFSDRSHNSLTGVTSSQHHVKTSKLSEITIDVAKDWAGKAINNPGNVDGVDISAHAANVNAHHTKFTITEHDTTARHTLGTVVPHDALASLTEKAHSSLTGVTANQHHAQAHTLASHSTKAHSELTGVTAAQHHAKTTSGEIDHGSVGGLADDDHTQYLNTTRHDTTTRHPLGTVVPHDALASLTEKAHSSLTGVTVAQHHARYTNAEAVAAVSAGNLTKLVVETNTLVADGGKVGIGIASPTTIHADAPLFGGSSPKTEIVTGTAGNVDYEELVTLRHAGIDATARTRRLGLLLKLSTEGSVTETNKSGGMVVESPSGWANSPSLYLLTANAKRLGIDYNGDISVITGNVSLAADRTVDGVDISNPVWPTTITHQGAILKSGTQTEGRCHAGLSPFMALAGNQVTVCFREKMTNTPSSVTLSNVPTTSENNMEAGYPQALRVSLFSFGFFIRAAAMGDANSCDKKFVTVGN